MNIIATVTGSIILLKSRGTSMDYSEDELRLKDGLIVKTITKVVTSPAEIHNKALWVRPYIQDVKVNSVSTLFVMNYEEIEEIIFPEGIVNIEEPSLRMGKLKKATLPLTYSCNCARAFSDIDTLVFRGRESYLNIPFDFLCELFSVGVNKVIFDKQVISR